MLPRPHSVRSWHRKIKESARRSDYLTTRGCIDLIEEMLRPRQTRRDLQWYLGISRDIVHVAETRQREHEMHEKMMYRPSVVAKGREEDDPAEIPLPPSPEPDDTESPTTRVGPTLEPRSPIDMIPFSTASTASEYLDRIIPDGKSFLPKLAERNHIFLVDNLTSMKKQWAEVELLVRAYVNLTYPRTWFYTRY